MGSVEGRVITKRDSDGTYNTYAWNRVDPEKETNPQVISSMYLAAGEMIKGIGQAHSHAISVEHSTRQSMGVYTRKELEVIR